MHTPHPPNKLLLSLPSYATVTMWGLRMPRAPKRAPLPPQTLLLRPLHGTAWPKLILTKHSNLWLPLFRINRLETQIFSAELQNLGPGWSMYKSCLWCPSNKHDVSWAWLSLLTLLLQCKFYSTSPFCVCNGPDPYKDGQINIWWSHKYENKLIWKKKYIFRGFGSNFQLFLIAWKIKVRK